MIKNILLSSGFFSKLISFAVVLMVLLITPALTFAAPGGAPPGGAPTGITNPVIDEKLGGDVKEAKEGVTFSYYFILIWRAIIAVGALAVLFAMINGALEWITAGGEQSKVSHARQKMTEAVVGMIILSGSFIVIYYIGNLFGFNLIEITIPTPGS